MMNNHAINVFPIYRDLEKVISPAEFVSNVLTDVSDRQTGIKRLKGLLGTFTKNFAGWQLGNLVKIPESSTDKWKEILENTIEYLMNEHFSADGWEDGGKGQHVILIWDELPTMLDNFLKREKGALVAMEMLDTLRALRQTHPRLRMVYTGSIGLHHVISKLKDAGYSNAPTNDMYPYGLKSLEEKDALELTIRLLVRSSITGLSNEKICKSG
jgi:hypothetical protein